MQVLKLKCESSMSNLLETSLKGSVGGSRTYRTPGPLRLSAVFVTQVVLFQLSNSLKVKFKILISLPVLILTVFIKNNEH